MRNLVRRLIKYFPKGMQLSRLQIALKIEKIGMLSHPSLKSVMEK